MNPALRSSAAHVFVESLDAPTLADDDQHHLFRVLRLRDGEVVSVSDGHGSWRPCTVSGESLVESGPIESTGASASVCVIAAAIPKGDRCEWMVQKLTEIGVHRIVLLHCERSVVRWDGDRARKQVARLQRIVREAAMQSRRVVLPEVVGPLSFGDVLAPNVVIAEPGGSAWSPPSGDVTVLIGPEGGFSPTELEQAAVAGGRLVSLGDHVLRVETAALVAAVRALATT